MEYVNSEYDELIFRFFLGENDNENKDIDYTDQIALYLKFQAIKLDNNESKVKQYFENFLKEKKIKDLECMKCFMAIIHIKKTLFNNFMGKSNG